MQGVLSKQWQSVHPRARTLQWRREGIEWAFGRKRAGLGCMNCSPAQAWQAPEGGCRTQGRPARGWSQHLHSEGHTHPCHRYKGHIGRCANHEGFFGPRLAAFGAAAARPLRTQPSHAAAHITTQSQPP